MSGHPGFVPHPLGDQALVYAREVSSPRSAGTRGEREAAALIRTKMAAWGYLCQEQFFPLRPSPWGLYRVALATGLVAVSLTYWFYSSYPEASLAGVVAFLALLFLSQRIWVALFDLGFLSKGTGRVSSNLLFCLPPGKGEGKPLSFFLVSHYDSKSQTFPLLVSIGLACLAGAGLALLTMLYILAAMGWSSPPFLVTSFTLVALAGILPLLAQRDGADSPGALDNGGALGLSLALAEYFKDNLSQGVAFYFLFTGAEEVGLQGSLAFVQARKKELDPARTFFLNLEGIGARGELLLIPALALKDKRQQRLLSWLKEAAGLQGIRLTALPLVPGLTMDHLAFRAAGWAAASLLSLSSSSLAIHTRGDRAELLEASALSQVAKLILALIKRVVVSLKVQEDSSFRVPVTEKEP